MSSYEMHRAAMKKFRDRAERAEAELERVKKVCKEMHTWLDYAFENIVSECYAYDCCQCDIPAGETPCPYCASSHFVDWWRTFKETHAKEAGL